MRIRTKYIVFVSIIHTIAFILAYIIIKDEVIYFISAEIIIIGSLLIAWSLYKQLIEPINMLLRGGDAIADKDFNTKYIKTGKYEMDQLIDVYNNMIDELRKERTLQEEQHFFLDKLIQSAPIGIIIQDFDANIKMVNPRGLALLKLSEKEINITDHPILNEIRNLGSGQSKTIVIDGFNTYKIQKSHFLDRGFNRNFVTIEELTTEILTAEKQVYGKVIRMMAHEVNNTIGPVNSIIQSTLGNEQLWVNENNSNIKNALQIAVDRNYNLASFVRNFAEVVRLPPPKMGLVNVNELLLNAGKLFEHKTKDAGIIIEYQLCDKEWTTPGDQTQLEQAMINIIKNSIESIGSSGIIRLTSDYKSRSVIISDSGGGIDPVYAEQLFTPFFSTKKDGQGVGLTLVKEIFVNHQFPFSLKKGENGYTDFTIKMK